MKQLQARIQKLVDQYGADKLYWDYDILEEDNEYKIMFMGDTMPLRPDLVKEIETCLKEFEQDTEDIDNKDIDNKDIDKSDDLIWELFIHEINYHNININIEEVDNAYLFAEVRALIHEIIEEEKEQEQ